jgi:predicted ABC-type ATPase
VANSWAWELGRRQLEQSIAERRDFTFETTLGGNTITGLLRRACDAGLAVRMQYVGLASPEQHIARVRARVARGGHNISDARIRARYDTSRQHCIDLLPHLTELRLYDNSAESAPDGPTPPVLRLLLHVERGRIVTVGPPPTMPEWAKPIVVAAENLAR